jgi:hypothetical protein
MPKRKLQEFEAGTAEDHTTGHHDPYTSFVKDMYEGLPKKPRLADSVTSANHVPPAIEHMVSYPEPQKTTGAKSVLVAVEELGNEMDMARTVQEMRCEDFLLQKTISDDEDVSSHDEIAALKKCSSKSKDQGT